MPLVTYNTLVYYTVKKGVNTMKKILILILSIVLIFSFVGCTEQPPEEEPTPPLDIKIAGLKGPTSIGMIKMIDEQATLGDNVAASYDIVPTPDTLVSKLLNGEYDFATLPTNVASIIYNKKGEYQVAGIPIWGVLYVVTNGVDINDWSDFNGNTVYPFAQASTPDVTFKYLLKQNGIDPEKDVTFDYSFQQAELAQALIAGQVTIAVLPEPFVTSALMKNPDLTIAMDLQEEWKAAHATSSVLPAEASYPMTAIVVKKEFAEAHPEIVETFLNSYDASIKWVNENPGDASFLVEKHEIGLSAPAAEKAIPRCNMNLIKASAAKDIITFYLNVLNDFSPQIIGGSMPDENFYVQE